MLFDHGCLWLQSLPFRHPSPDPSTPPSSTDHAPLWTWYQKLRDPSEPSRPAPLCWAHISHMCTSFFVLNSSWQLQRKLDFLQIHGIQHNLQRAGCMPPDRALLVSSNGSSLSFSWTLIDLSAWLFTTNTDDPSGFKISIMLSNLSSHLVQKL